MLAYESLLQKIIPHQRRKVTCKQAKAKLVWVFAASMSNLSNGLRWEALWTAKQFLETGSMMFECSEFLLPQALRQAASGEVWTDWIILQQLVLMQYVNLLCKSTTLAAYSRAQCWRSLHRTGCEKTMLSTFSTECCTRLPSSLVLYVAQKVHIERLQIEYKITEQG